MNDNRISGKKLVLVGALVLIVVAGSARIFAVFYLRDMANPSPTTLPSTQP